jgi:hypothetical protein
VDGRANLRSALTASPTDIVLKFPVSDNLVDFKSPNRLAYFPKSRGSKSIHIQVLQTTMGTISLTKAYQGLASMMLNITPLPLQPVLANNMNDF